MPDLRLAIPAAALWACCGVGVGLAEAMVGVAVAAAMGGVVALAAAIVAGRRGERRGRPVRHHAAWGQRLRASRRPWPSVAISLAAVALGAASIAALAPGRTDAALQAASTHHATVEVALRVESAPKRSAPGLDGAERWRLRGTTVAASTAPPGRALPPIHAGVPVSVLVPGTAHSVRAYTLGTVIAGSMSVRPNEPGEATTFTLRGTAAPEVREPPPWWLAWPSPVRAAFADAAATTPGDGGTLLPGLAIGDETNVGAELDDAMKVSALSHLTAVSGDMASNTGVCSKVSKPERIVWAPVIRRHLAVPARSCHELVGRSLGL
ncbi:hypothetical protein ABH923_000332 [Leifsonia sp. EB41]|uniref:hypothetical protein n=1 Tax=Leifsonia sp. EB41 TaxID=3156260 RepID=UPI00351340EE